MRGGVEASRRQGYELSTTEVAMTKVEAVGELCHSIRWCLPRRSNSKPS